MPYLNHILLLLFIAAIAIGIIALIKIKQSINMFKLLELVPYYKYLLTYNLIAAIYLMQTYFELNFLKRPDSIHQHVLIGIIFRMLLYIPISLIPIYFFPHATFAIVKTDLSKFTRYLLITISAVIIILCLTSFFNILYLNDFLFYDITDQSWSAYYFVVFLCSSLLAFFRFEKLKSRQAKTTVATFLIAYLIFYIVHFVYTFIITQTKLLSFIYTPTRWILINLLPLVGLKTFIKYYYGLDISQPEELSRILQFATKFNLSDREREILLPLYKGKNNREIAVELFISEQTVKNHLHNIYKKTEIKSRLELMKAIISNNE